MFARRDRSSDSEKDHSQGPSPRVSQLQKMVFEVLTAGEKSGREICKGIKERFQKSVPYGSLYVALEGMEREGWVTSRTVAGGPERDGNSKKYYKLSGTGCRRYDALRLEAQGFPDLGGLAPG